MLTKITEHDLLQYVIHLPLLLLPHQLLNLQHSRRIIPGLLPQSQTLLINGPHQRIKQSHQLPIHLNLLLLIEKYPTNKQQRMVDEKSNYLYFDPGKKRKMVPQHQIDQQSVQLLLITIFHSFVTALNHHHQCPQHLLVQLELTQTTVLEQQLFLNILPHKKFVLVLQNISHDPRIKKKVDNLHQIDMISPQQHLQ